MNIKWYLNRLRAMSGEEVFWRIGQKRIERIERKNFAKEPIRVTEGIFYPDKEELVFHAKKVPIAALGAAEKDGTVVIDGVSGRIALLGGYDYEAYRKDWHAGFQTTQKWPLIFSYDLTYKQRDDIGDARTNWELNRHFQFALLACNYYRTGEEKHLEELEELFEDWNAGNPFLMGISWTSVMEVAIRDINWAFALAFLAGAPGPRDAKQKRNPSCAAGGREKRIEELCVQLCNGIVNMTSYISTHYSRFSSANNHVIVEAAAMGIAGIAMECGEWYETAFSILQSEIPRQNYKDGINKEMSLHYQSFFMEAVGLLMLTMQHNGLPVPQMWKNRLSEMSRYLSDCQGSYGETVVFGDDDEGKILDLEGEGELAPGRSGSEKEKEKIRRRNHYRYVLQLMSLVLPERYAETIEDKTLLLLASEKQKERLADKPYYRNADSVCYAQGGVSFLKSRDGRMLIGIDHGPLGFGSIAAHGHADALSFQMYLDGKCVFADPGTYLYHTDIQSRNSFRMTKNHNTLTIDERDQSEMLGAFLWGRRANTTLVSYDLQDELQYVEAEQDGYAPIIHNRRFEFDGAGRLKVIDTLSGVEGDTGYEIGLLLGEGCRLEEEKENQWRIQAGPDCAVELKINAPGSKVLIEEGKLSVSYGNMEKTRRIRICGRTETDCRMSIEIRRG